MSPALSPVRKLTLCLLLSFAALPASANLTFATPKQPAVKPAATPVPAPVGINAPRFTPKERADLAALPLPKTAETELFKYLSQKTGKTMKLPMHPHNVSALGSWFFARQVNSSAADYADSGPDLPHPD